jgi:hypothetical protein
MFMLSIVSMFPNPIRYGVSRGTTFGNQFIFAADLRGSTAPAWLAQVVFIVESEFFQAGAPHSSALALFFSK